MLEIIGLDTRTQMVYETLVNSPPLTLEELRQELTISEADLNSALDDLAARGLFTWARGHPRRLVPAPPDVALEILLLEQQQQINQARLFTEQLAERHRLASSGENPADVIEVISGRAAVTESIERVFRDARTQIRLIDMHPYVLAPEILTSLHAETLRRGVSYRALYDVETVASLDLRAETEPATAGSEQVRVLPAAPTKLLMSDDRLALLPIQSSPHEIDSIAAVHPSAVLEALHSLFETLWQTALPLPGSDTPALIADTPTTVDSRIVALMTAGVPDRAIAAQLGLSYRTFQRRTRALMDLLGARTRFQAGLQAAFRGWVHHPNTSPTAPE
ncbi:helix-turn-helix domain-containing protein [Kibdelosporangium aridum]|uniref:Sugar-specific transcriptional regulator TrmB n=1 Tax=Kibdelosporangium aridum TaxID=2030 RepID=A0A1W2FFC9_KIBAR|nr:helix-turn-helix domain-containing protein [Kibdelosporangium aridum]SMD20372.1 Sugar-specific transcriptional regulator TrmB [Kibdelosporangium aridum]